MSHRALVLLAGFALATAATPQEPQALRVLYAGQPGHPRSESFAAFLGEHFQAVGTLDFRKLDRETARTWDVVVFDLPADLGFDDLKGRELPAGFDRPTVLVGSWAARLAEKAKLKIDDG